MTTGDYSLTKGLDIFTSDDDKIGQVKLIRGRYFQVDAAMQPDYWLSHDSISSVTGRGVLLNFEKDHLGDHKIDEGMVQAA